MVKNVNHKKSDFTNNDDSTMNDEKLQAVPIFQDFH